MNAGRCYVWLSLLLCPLAGYAAPRVNLTGIVNVGSNQTALIEIHEERRAPRMPILSVGERDGECEVLAINPDAGTATIQWRKTGERFVLHLRADEGQQLSCALNLNQARLPQVLEAYQELSGRTLVRSPNLVDAPINLQTAPGLSAADCANALEKAIHRAGTLIKHRGNEFGFAVPPKQAEIVDAIPDPPVRGKDDEEVFPRGLIMFRQGDVLQVLEIYSELAGRTVLRPQRIPHAKVTVRSQTALTRSQAIWLLQAALRLGDVAVVHSDENFAFAVAASDVNQLPEFNAEALGAKIKGPSKPEHLKLNDVDAESFLKAYGAVVGREPLPLPDNLPKVGFSLTTHAPLSATERLFALESLATLNHMAIELVGDDRVAIRHASVMKRSRFFRAADQVDEDVGK